MYKKQWRTQDIVLGGTNIYIISRGAICEVYIKNFNKYKRFFFKKNSEGQHLGPPLTRRMIKDTRENQIKQALV